MDPSLVVPDPAKSVRGGAIEPWANLMKGESWSGSIIAKVAKTFGIDLDRPWSALSAKHRDVLLHGSRGRKIELTYTWSSGKIEYARAFEGVLNEPRAPPSRDGAKACAAGTCEQFCRRRAARLRRGCACAPSRGGTPSAGARSTRSRG